MNQYASENLGHNYLICNIRHIVDGLLTRLCQAWQAKRHVV